MFRDDYAHAKLDNFWKIYGIVALVLVTVLFGYGKFEGNKVRWANQRVVEVQRLYKAQQQNWKKAVASYETKIKELKSKNAKK